MVRIDPTWREALRSEWDAPYFLLLAEAVRERYNSPGATYPPAGQVFAAFDSCPLDRVKVVILGQDPYHGPGMANGLAFSVNDGTPIPRSLANIFREIATDLGTPSPQSGNLQRWAEQGVLLLNSTLTVDAHAPGSHQGLGWEQFTDRVVQVLSDTCSRLVFMLWGAYAIRKGAIIDRDRHLVLTAPHPSPLSASRGFFGCRHFSRANDYLTQHGKEPIQW